MPGIVALISAISDDVVAALAAASLPALTEGHILLGPEYVAESSAPPRIVFVPKGSTWGPKTMAARPTVAAAELTLEIAARSLLTEEAGFDVAVWGQAAIPDPANDYDATQVLYQQVIRSIHTIAHGCYKLSPGRWDAGSKLVVDGRLFVFGVSFSTPLVDRILEQAPSDVALSITTKIQPDDGSISETGCASP